MDKNDLKLNQLPPPPVGKEGVTLESLSQLPPPPKDKKGFTLEELISKKPKGEKGLQGVATGAFKSLADTVVGAGELLQGAGTAITKAVLPEGAEKYLGVDQTGIKALESGTESNLNLEKIIAPEGGAEKFGKTATDIAQFAVSGGQVATAQRGAGAVSKIAGQVASDVAVQSAQQGNLEGTGKQAAITAGLSAVPLVGPLLGKLGAGKLATKVAANLEKINLRLSPIDNAKLAKKGDEIASFLASKKITGTPEQRFAKIDELYNQFEDKVQKTLTNVGDGAKRIKYSKNEVIQSIKNLPDSFLSEANDPLVYDQLGRDVKKFISFIQKQKGDFIDATKINAYKRSYAKSARNKSGDAVIDESREVLSDGLYNLILKDNPELQKINQEYGKVILSRKLMSKALGRNELGLIGNLIGITAGGAIGSMGGGVGAAIGAAAGPKVGKLIAGTKARSILGSRVQSFGDYLKTAKLDEAGNFIIPRSVLNGLFKGQ